MFDIGFWELVLLFGIGLMVLGPERMPKVAAQLGRWAGQARNMARNLTSQIQDEIEPIKSSVDSMQNSMSESMNKMDETLNTDFSARRPEPGEHTTEASPEESANDSQHADGAAAEPDAVKLDAGKSDKAS
jgi:sec-independent protein translocase protein TatB